MIDGLEGFVLVIPARMKSRRLPGKPLIDIYGQSVLYRTYVKCVEVFPADQTYVATDSNDILEHCDKHNIQAIMTSSECLTGTDRVAEFSNVIDANIYINVQGDEPLMNPADIEKVILACKQFRGEIINGYAPIENEEQYSNLNTPKVVLRPDGRLLYMSRAPIPGNKSGKFIKAWRQICVYAFTKTALQDFSLINKKTPLESEEDIEILRFLELGYEVRMIPLSSDSIAVDTPTDVERVKEVVKHL
jgi:3-deoxy-manno-octulosonate cytidylyltransferase (CMP-KDO synthetase)